MYKISMATIAEAFNDHDRFKSVYFHHLKINTYWRWLY